VRTPPIGLCCSALLAASVLGQASGDGGAAELLETLRRIANPYRVLHVIAHPDDEDSGTVTYLSRGLGVDVTIASITRGESGANLVTGDFFDALGVLRTLEFRTAAQYYQARLRFTRFADFGYSKSLDETFKNWDREGALADLVRIIREERPHVILARWRGDSRDGHGHHQAAGLLAQEAFHGASDFRRFPAEDEDRWQPLKLYSNNRRETDPWTVQVDSGVYDPLHGQTFAQIGREGIRSHRSQGAGSAIAGSGPAIRYYELMASKVGPADQETSVFERIDEQIPAALREPIERATRLYRVDNPLACIPALIDGLRAVRRLRAKIDSQDLLRREELIENAIALALGAKLDFLVQPAQEPPARLSSFMPYETLRVVTPGDKFEAKVNLQSGLATLRDVEYSIETPAGWQVTEVAESRYSIQAPETIISSAVHWSRPSVWNVEYQPGNEELWGQALPEPQLAARASFTIDGVPVSLSAPLLASHLDEQRIQRRSPLATGPAVSIEFKTDAGLLPVGSREYSAVVGLRNNTSRPVTGAIELEVPIGWESGEPRGFSFQGEGQEQQMAITVRSPRTADPGNYPIEAIAIYEGGQSKAGFRRVTSVGGESAYLSRPARHEVSIVEVETAPNLSIGYVTGTGDDVPSAIRQLSPAVTLLDSDYLASGDLDRFDTILLGIRAYAVRDDLKAHNARLLEYASRGGVLIVQYNTPEFDNNYGPYPYSMTRRPEEVSQEDSPVVILDSDDSVFRWPNRITSDDFDGWKEQRGSKFLVEWDERYKPLLETHDTDQDPQRGGWLVARHGQGLYVYCAYAWYRQLPYGVPGAARLFANLISLGSPNAPWR